MLFERERNVGEIARSLRRRLHSDGRERIAQVRFPKARIENVQTIKPRAQLPKRTEVLYAEDSYVLRVGVPIEIRSRMFLDELCQRVCGLTCLRSCGKVSPRDEIELLLAVNLRGTHGLLLLNSLLLTVQRDKCRERFLRSKKDLLTET